MVGYCTADLFPAVWNGAGTLVMVELTDTVVPVTFSRGCCMEEQGALAMGWLPVIGILVPLSRAWCMAALAMGQLPALL